MTQPDNQGNIWSRGLWLLWPFLFLALRLAAPFIPVPSVIVGDIAATVVFLLIPLLWLRALSLRNIHPGLAFGLFIVFALVWGEFLLGRPFGLLGLVNWRDHPDARLAMFVMYRPVADLALITAGALLGTALARIISDPKMLLPVALAGALVDYWGVYMGTTNLALRLAPEVVRSVSAAIPTFGGAVRGGLSHGLEPASFVGFGDWLFLSMFLTVAARYDLQPRRTFWAMLAFLVPAMLLVLFGGVDHLPAVVPMALALFVVNGRRLKLSRQEGIATAIAIVMVGALLYGLFTLGMRLMPPAAPTEPAAPSAAPAAGSSVPGR